MWVLSRESSEYSYKLVYVFACVSTFSRSHNHFVLYFSIPSYFLSLYTVWLSFSIPMHIVFFCFVLFIRFYEQSIIYVKFPSFQTPNNSQELSSSQTASNTCAMFVPRFHDFLHFDALRGCCCCWFGCDSHPTLAWRRELPLSTPANRFPLHTGSRASTGPPPS